jgi:hypothetical protein
VVAAPPCGPAAESPVDTLGRASSSIWQSNGLLIRRFGVQVPGGPQRHLDRIGQTPWVLLPRQRLGVGAKAYVVGRTRIVATAIACSAPGPDPSPTQADPEPPSRTPPTFPCRRSIPYGSIAHPSIRRRSTCLGQGLPVPRRDAAWGAPLLLMDLHGCPKRQVRQMLHVRVVDADAPV